jgi:methylglutamate dehydrogenase subunit D
VADGTFVALSAFHGVARAGRHGNPDGGPGVRVRLLSPLSIAVIAPAPGAHDLCLGALAAAFGGDWAKIAQCRSSAGVAGARLFWAGPGRFVVTLPEEIDIESRLRAVCGESAAIVDQSDGRFVLRLDGPRVRETLAKGVSIDLHPKAFVSGDTALVQVSHLQTQLTAIDGAQGFEMMCPRAAAGDVWHWLVESATEHGVELEPFA